MKRIIPIICAIMTIPSFASTMCAANNTIAIVLDPNIDGDSHMYSATNMTWNTTFPYGELSGEALCSTTSSTYGTVGNPDESGGGQNCWCRTTNPVLSRWVFCINRGVECANYCALYCGDRVRYRVDFRIALFGSVAQ